MRKCKPLFLSIAYLCIIGVFVALTVLGYRYLIHRNSLMEGAIVNSARMSLEMKILEVEHLILRWESKVIYDFLSRGATANLSIPEIEHGLKKKYPLLSGLTVVDRNKLHELNKTSAMRQLQAEMEKTQPATFELRHFSLMTGDMPEQLSYILLPSADGPYYLILSLKTDYFQTTFLDRALDEIAQDRKFRSVFITTSDGKNKEPIDSSLEQITVETSFANLFSFWRVMAEVEMSGVKKRARIEAFAFFGITFITVLLIGISIFFIAIYIHQEKSTSEIKSEMVSTVSHELKTPIALIRMYTETLLMNRIRNSSKKNDYYHIIIEACDRLNLIINNILDFSQIEKGIKKYHFSKHNFQDTIAQLLETYSHYIRHQGFTFNCTIEDELPLFYFDKVAITQALGNLLDNAMKFSDKEKRIEVRLTREGGFAVITVADSGIGMDQETIRSIFKPYFRARSTNRGTGIGLSLVKHAVDSHNGSILVESAVGSGSVFTVKLPIAEKPHGA